MMKHVLLLIIGLLPPPCEAQVIKVFKRMSDRIDITLPEGKLSICPLTDNAVRIKFFKDVDVRMPELVSTSGVRTAGFMVSDSPSRLEVRVKNIVVALDKQDGKLPFEDNSGKIFLSEKAGTRKLVPDSVMGEPCFVAEQSFESPAANAFFGWDSSRMDTTT